MHNHIVWVDQQPFLFPGNEHTESLGNDVSAAGTRAINLGSIWAVVTNHAALTWLGGRFSLFVEENHSGHCPVPCDVFVRVHPETSGNMCGVPSFVGNSIQVYVFSKYY